MNKNDDNDNKDDGSVWTSYSDLFTTVAIIFLVMFVFALIKAGVSSLQTLQQKKIHEEELKGKVTEADKKKAQKNLNKINKSIDKMNEYQDLISQKVVEMNDFAKKLKDNKKVFEEMVESHKKQEAILKIANSKLIETEKNLKNEIELKRNLEKEVKVKANELSQTISAKDKVIEEIKRAKEELDKLNIERKQKIAFLEKDLIDQKDEMQKKLVQQKNIQTEIIKNADIEKQKVTEQFKKQISEIMEQKDLSIKEVKKQVADVEKKKDEVIKKYEEKIKKLVSDRDRTIQKLKIENEKSERQNQQIVAEIESKDVEISEWQKKEAELKSLLNQKQIEVNKKNEVVKNSANQIKQVQRQIASIEEEKQLIAVELEKSKEQLQKQRMNEASLSAKVSDLAKQVAQSKDKAKQLFLEAEKLKKLSHDYAVRVQNLEGDHSKAIDDNKKLNQQKKHLEGLNAQIEQSKNELELKVANLSGELENNRLQTNNAKAESQRLGSKIEKMLVQHQGEVSKLSDKIQGLDRNNRELKNKLNDSQAKINALTEYSRKMMGDHAKEVDDLNRKIAGMDKSKGNIINELKSKLADITKKHVIETKDLQSQIAQAKNELDQQLQLKKTCDLENEKLAGVITKINGNMGNKLDELQKQNSVLLTQYKQCSAEQKQVLNNNKSLKDTVKNIGRKIASLKSDLRSNIAKKLADKFKRSNVSAHVDPVTGNVTLDLGKNFLFEKNSYKISLKAKEQLKKIIPLYADVLFSEGKVSDQISSFNIEGHASPSYRGKFIDPEKINTKAYSYNMLLSGQRAAAISSFMFGPKIGEYQHKVELKKKTRSVGYGYTMPIKYMGTKDRSIASNNYCYPYDCSLSQRVELSFTLRDDNESLEKLFDIASEVK